VVEKSGGEAQIPATDLAPRPGSFSLGSRESRAAARALLEKLRRPKRPPEGTIDLSSASDERCQEIYRKIQRFRKREPIRDGEPYFQIAFPSGFRPHDEQEPKDRPRDDCPEILSDLREESSATHLQRPLDRNRGISALVRCNLELLQEC
jgi:hypothetical protein